MNAKPMTDGQRLFWRGILAFARTTRRGRNVDLEAAADALALEQEIEARLQADEAPAQLVAEPTGENHAR
jgi:hypothetical protein